MTQARFFVRRNKFFCRHNFACLGLILIGSLTLPASAQVETKYCVIGNGNGVGWNWEIRDLATDGFITGDFVAGINGTTGELVQAFVNSINAARPVGQNFPNAQQVESSGCGPDPSAAFSITTEAPRVLNVSVGAGGALTPVDATCPAPVTQNCLSTAVNFNPSIFIQPNTTSIPTISQWGAIVMTLLLLTAGTIILRRRSRMIEMAQSTA
ncbi:MAG: hypothetical protein DHS20C16_31820 [Phycisphaerae bacterium]|nr:MAG: hypothetical protein DHS20C16_31820 [Phycisphaerae bacterium]